MSCEVVRILVSLFISLFSDRFGLTLAHRCSFRTVWDWVLWWLSAVTMLTTTTSTSQYQPLLDFAYLSDTPEQHEVLPCIIAVKIVARFTNKTQIR